MSTTNNTEGRKMQDFSKEMTKEDCKQVVARKYGLGKTLVMGHLSKYWEEAMELYGTNSAIIIQKQEEIKKLKAMCLEEIQKNTIAGVAKQVNEIGVLNQNLHKQLTNISQKYLLLEELLKKLVAAIEGEGLCNCDGANCKVPATLILRGQENVHKYCTTHSPVIPEVEEEYKIGEILLEIKNTLIEEK